MPRTNTNDQAPIGKVGLFRLCAQNGIATGQVLYTNTTQGISVVITTIDIVSFSLGTSSSAAIGILTTSSGSTFGLFGAETGAGQFDTFSWRGDGVLYAGDQLVVIAASGTWSCVASGYKAPTIWTS